eukprot:6175601-Pleurochrysis_carterae.AAC.6
MPAQLGYVADSSAEKEGGQASRPQHGLAAFSATLVGEGSQTHPPMDRTLSKLHLSRRTNRRPSKL